jgi:hypothetical protein
MFPIEQILQRDGARTLLGPCMRLRIMFNDRQRK